MRWLLVALFTTAAAFAAGQGAQLPDGDGKAIVNAACTTCHGVDLITAKSVSRADWAGTVDRMKTNGVTQDATQTTTVIDYLAKSFGPKGAAPAPAPGAAPASQDSAAADAAGKALVDNKCAGCHGLDLITGKTANRVDWTATLDRMKSYGASLDDKETATMLDYLLKHYGPKDQAAAAPTPAAAAAAAPDAGKNLLTASCTSCHDLDLVTNRTGSVAEWQEVVDRMNARGAGLAEKDIPVLVAYLAKTYPTKK
jgi:cytochrome c5